MVGETPNTFGREIRDQCECIAQQMPTVCDFGRCMLVNIIDILEVICFLWCVLHAILVSIFDNFAIS